MSKSPLSGAFAGSSEPAKKNKKNGALLLISGIALATSIGGVLAANSITIADVQFGQGAADIASCTDNAIVSITQGYVSSAFVVNEVSVETEDDCSAYNLVVTVLDSSGTALYTSSATTGPAAGEAIDFDLTSESPRIAADEVDVITVTTE
jgi:hypothetical protein